MKKQGRKQGWQGYEKQDLEQDRKLGQQLEEKEEPPRPPSWRPVVLTRTVADRECRLRRAAFVHVIQRLVVLTRTVADRECRLRQAAFVHVIQSAQPNVLSDSPNEREGSPLGLPGH